MKDGLILIAALVGIFVVWVWTGGPSRPISFAGPFITPITAPDDTQTGYGEQLWNGSDGTGWSLDSAFGSYEGSAGTAAPGGPSASSYQVVFTSGASGPAYPDASREYVSFRNVGSAPVNVTGWSVMSERSGNGARVLQGAEVADPRGTASLTDIVLAPGMEAVVYTRRSPAGTQSYRDNTCVPYIYDRTRYTDCVREHRRDVRFLGDTWHIYLNQSSDLWQDDQETLLLLDAQGRTVDRTSY